MSGRPLLLAMDTSTLVCSVACGYADDVRAEHHEPAPRAHLERLMPAVQDVARAAGVSLGELDGLVAGLGPGSYTGVRVAVSTARALAQALEIPIIGVCSLDALAADGRPGRLICAMSEAGRGRVYYRLYRRSDRQSLPEALGGPESGLPAEAAAAAAESRGPDEEVELRGPSDYPRASVLMRLAVDGLACGGQPINDVVPIYLGPTQVHQAGGGAACAPKATGHASELRSRDGGGGR